jgi:glyoxylase-like metal-dependent hydrolase (beta-lactamase superfamily II)
MTEKKQESTPLAYEVHMIKRPGLARGLPPGTESLQWVVNTATLISGERDAVIVDTYVAIDHNRQLADWIAKSGKNLTTIYITHAHGDHAFGLKILLDRFPKARSVATKAVVKALLSQLDPDYVQSFWQARFPGQIPRSFVVPEVLEGNEFEVEGHPLVVLDDGFTDTEPSTSLYVPSIGLVVAGDAVYGQTHPYLAETSEQSRLNWIAALEHIEALKPRAVVAGHRKPEDGESPQYLEATRQYIQDFNRLNHETKTARELYDKMLSLYPDRSNPGSLWGAANAAKAQ